MKQTLLITGGTGFLGKRLGVTLRDQYDVVLTGRNNKQNMHAEQFSGCRVLPMDVANIEAVRDTFTETRPSVVIHAAATKFVDWCVTQALSPAECDDEALSQFNAFVEAQNYALVMRRSRKDNVYALEREAKVQRKLDELERTRRELLEKRSG